MSQQFDFESAEYSLELILHVTKRQSLKKVYDLKSFELTEFRDSFWFPEKLDRSNSNFLKYFHRL